MITDSWYAARKMAGPATPLTSAGPKGSQDQPYDASAQHGPPNLPDHAMESKVVISAIE